MNALKTIMSSVSNGKIFFLLFISKYLPNIKCPFTIFQVREKLKENYVSVKCVYRIC